MSDTRPNSYTVLVLAADGKSTQIEITGKSYSTHAETGVLNFYNTANDIVASFAKGVWMAVERKGD